MSPFMYKIAQGNAEGRALFLSFVLHVSVIGFYLLFMEQTTTHLMSSKAIVIEISNIERIAPKPEIPTPPQPEPMVEQVKPIEPPKPIEPVVKPIEKPKPKPKPLEEPKAFQEKVMEQPVEYSIPQTTPVAHPVSNASATTPMTPSSTSAEAYERTDFEIIRDKVLSRLIYPSVARRMGWNGVVHIALLIDTDGRLVSATIHKSSNRTSLDEAALEAALKLQGVQLPKPKSLSTVILPIAFKLR
ncbi:energy transducer TonB [Sulfurospirillum barnesii]|uniref:TonB family protein n=1 Tax=Sulfurospirillum barnesii (strain ATCC 700032 / DSM 10660 / SES-3) TaxID=760154 RepID=I3XY92_SULBS|nr:TonB family protein [Sulfurospirillum barnesii]AFL68916.1 TonB family protein [Sulfurospirillum barnesii SES-3]